jgi:hypothetical protein
MSHMLGAILISLAAKILRTGYYSFGTRYEFHLVLTCQMPMHADDHAAPVIALSVWPS